MIWKATAILGVVACVLGDGHHAISEQQIVLNVKPEHHGHHGELAHIGEHLPEHHDQYAWSYPSYEFSYRVEDPHTHDYKGQHEHRDGDVVKGMYWLLQPDGYKRTVKYMADKHSGFHADVHYEKTHYPIHSNVILDPKEVPIEHKVEPIDAKPSPKIIETRSAIEQEYREEQRLPSLRHHRPILLEHHHEHWHHKPEPRKEELRSEERPRVEIRREEPRREERPRVEIRREEPRREERPRLEIRREEPRREERPRVEIRREEPRREERPRVEIRREEPRREERPRVEIRREEPRREERPRVEIRREEPRREERLGAEIRREEPRRDEHPKSHHSHKVIENYYQKGVHHHISHHHKEHKPHHLEEHKSHARVEYWPPHHKEERHEEKREEVREERREERREEEREERREPERREPERREPERREPEMREPERREPERREPERREPERREPERHRYEQDHHWESERLREIAPRHDHGHHEDLHKSHNEHHHIPPQDLQYRPHVGEPYYGPHRRYHRQAAQKVEKAEKTKE